MKYRKSGLDKERKAAIVQKILRHFEQDQVYLNCAYDLECLSRDLQISRHHISESINDELNTSFLELLNKYRLDEVKKRMLRRENQKYTLLGIAYDSGFNSKATFNRIFKKYTGFTPSGFKVKLMAS